MQCVVKRGMSCLQQDAKISKKSASPSGLLSTIPAGPACKRTGPAKLIYKYEAL